MFGEEPFQQIKEGGQKESANEQISMVLPKGSLGVVGQFEIDP